MQTRQNEFIGDCSLQDVIEQLLKGLIKSGFLDLDDESDTIE